jgi:hypothetical protein
MSVLRSDPFNLVKGDLIVARINAANIKGFNASTSSSPDSAFTVVVEVEPTAPTAPSRGLNTDYNVLHATWPSISSYTIASGGITAAITSYEV